MVWRNSKRRLVENPMNHWIIIPVILPLLAGVSLLLSSGRGLALQRILSVVATGGLVLLAGGLLYWTTGDDYQVYHLGDWPAPYGIVLVLDRLSALMLLLTALVALFSLWYALGGTDTQGAYFHALFHFQLLGLNGAFLTGDLFNLFVFFEILLIASYGLLLHGGGKARTGAGLHYVVLNLVGSSLFLFAMGVLYGVIGTLNMADLALKMSAAAPRNASLVQAGALLLLIVFALKAALLPLYFWLPGAYSNTSAPVAALFAIMTKVGVYAIVRVFTLIFGDAGGIAAHVAAPWLLPIALATLVAGTLGVLASRDLGRMLAYFVVASIGTLLAAVGLFSPAGLYAALVYLMHTTLVTAGMFLLADAIRIQRGDLAYQSEGPVSQPLLLGSLFFLGAMALAGMPPLSGFLGKVMILGAAAENPAAAWVWSVVLGSGLLSLIALSRAGSILFWKTAEAPSARSSPATAFPMIALLTSSMLLVAAGQPISDFASATARQLMAAGSYVESVLGSAYMDAFHSQVRG
jgi:multicomponent K+:H+ antiporter subunit D